MTWWRWSTRASAAMILTLHFWYILTSSPYTDVIISAMASQITSFTGVYSTVYSGACQSKHQSSASLAFVRGNSPVTGEFPAQRASNAENVSIWRRHRGQKRCYKLQTRAHLSLSQSLNSVGESIFDFHFGQHFNVVRIVQAHEVQEEFRKGYKAISDNLQKYVR